jgi:autotransporter-associated beta strand protein
MKPTLTLRSFLFGSTLLATAISLHATPYYWNTADGSWEDENKWSDNATSGGTTGVDPTSSDTVVFNQSSVNGAEIITLNGATSIGAITFANTGTTSIRSDTAGTNRVLTIGAGGITMASTAGQSDIGAAGAGSQPTVSVTLDASQEWENNSGATLFVRNGGNLGAHTLTLTTTGSGAINFAGAVTGNGGSIIVSANSTAAMTSNASTYSGTTTIHSGGTLTINDLKNSNSSSGLGQKSTNVASNLVIDGGKLRVQVSSTDSDRLFTMGAGGATLEAINTGVNSGQIKLTNTGAIAYTGVGNRTLTLGGTSDDVGGSLIALDIDDVGGGNGIVSLVKNGTHAWTVSGASNSYSGGTTLKQGTLILANNSAAGATAGTIKIEDSTEADLQINSGITIANGITFSNTNANSSVIRQVAAFDNNDLTTQDKYTTGTTGALKSSFAGGRDTTAAILAGTNGGSAKDLTLKFSASPSVSVSNDGIRRSDVFSVANSGSFDTFVLQLTVPDGLAAGSVLGWLNDSNQWVTAGTNFILGAYNNSLTLGNYGFDSSTNSTWAVVSQGGSYAAIPEPTTALAGLLLAAGLLRRRRA